MEEQLNELNEIIELIKQNIEKIINVEYGEDYYSINHIFKEKEVKHYVLTADGQDSLGMICGGQVTVVFERI